MKNTLDLPISRTLPRFETHFLTIYKRLKPHWNFIKYEKSLMNVLKFALFWIPDSGIINFLNIIFEY